MGSEHSKNSTSSSDNKSSEKKNKSDHIKIVTYNMKITSFSENIFNNILMYLTYEKKNIIYCIQGVYDKKFRKKLIKILNEKYLKYLPIDSIIPLYDFNDKDIEKSGLLLIATYPILNYNIYTFPQPDISLIKTIDKYDKGILTANLLIHKHIVSIYNISLQSDLKLNILDCKDIRHLQIKILLTKIEENILFINNNYNDNIISFSNIHIIIGSLYDPIVNNKILDSINIKPINWINDIEPYTNINNKKKYEYIYFYLYNYDTSTKTDILDFFKELNIEIIESKIKTNVIYTENMPYEILFKISKN
jgi:hypothetical protein